MALQLPNTKLQEVFEAVREAALDRSPVSGLTHQFYRYPARFSPTFARSCIETFSKPGDVVLDPYMGGGTTIVEAMVSGRRAVGSDINSLAVFVASTKTSRLSHQDKAAIEQWAADIVPTLRCTEPLDSTCHELQHRPRNMSMASVRWHRKLLAICMASIDEHFSTARSRRFARCVLLNAAQWALNGRKRVPTTRELRDRIQTACRDMLRGADEFELRISTQPHRVYPPVLRQNDAEYIHKDPQIARHSPVDLVVTSPPYPGIHMLYHRWQVDGRKETDAPYWIAACNDGDGSTHYNFADRRPQGVHRYFEKAEAAFASVRRVMRDGAILVQMVAFSEPHSQLPKYLQSMRNAGFSELRVTGQKRIWREVPGRRWYANLHGKTPSSREVVLIHTAD